MLGGAITFVVVALQLLHFQWMGFPDGGLTDLERGQKAAWRVVGGVGGLLALAAFASGAQREPSARAWRVLAGATVALLLTALTLDWLLRRVLVHGGGG